MERGPMVAAAILSTALLAGCQSTTQVKEASGLEGTPTPDEAESVVKTDMSRMRGKWEGRGDTDGARRTLEVDTNAQGNPWFKYCYLAHCRTSKGHTLTHVSITPTKVKLPLERGRAVHVRTRWRDPAREAEVPNENDQFRHEARNRVK